MKRVITFMMALALVLSLGVTAFAAAGTDGSITISNATAGETYNIYKIFEATYDSETNSVTYTIDSGNQFFTKLFGADGTASNEYFEYHATTGVVTRKDGKTDTELFAYLGTLIESATATATSTEDETTRTFSGLTYGYYVIERENGNDNAVTITNVNKTATVIDKNQLPGGDFKKEFNDDRAATEVTGETVDGKVWVGTASVGETIQWKLTFTATNYDKDDAVLSYTITDSLSPAGWAVYNQDVVVKVNGNLIDNATVAYSANGFTINIPWVDDANEFLYTGTTFPVEVTYSATVQAAAANKTDLLNTASVTWKDSASDTNTTYSDKTEIEIFNLGFTKVDGTDNDKTLAGAQFKLYRDEACANEVKVKEVTPGVYMVDPDGTAVIESPEGGKVVILGLAKGTYYLKETKAPAGYNLMEGTKDVAVGGETTIWTVGTVDYAVNKAEVLVENFSGVVLPNTGGKGTMMMITFGTMLAIAFAVLLITQKKMSIYRD